MKRRYDLLYALGALLSSPILAIGLLRTGKWRTDWKGRVGKIPSLPPDPRPTILLHGVSVGEINATRQLVASLTAPEAPPVRVVVSATTNTGFDRALELYGNSLPVVRFPFDFTWMVSRFFDAVQPDAVALMELEVWPNLTQVCRIRGVPLAVINGRLSNTSFRHYRWIRPFVRSMFRSLSAVGAQTEEYADRFEGLGTPRNRITITDTMKWDTVKLVDQVDGAEELRRAMGIDPDRPLVVVGSTGPGEEQLFLAGNPDAIQLLLVPRKPERFDEVAKLAPGMVRRTLNPDGSEGKGGDLFLLDTMGELTKAFSLADVAVVGRSFIPMGGSDPIEAIALGKPTVMGPHHDNFREVVEAFEEPGGICITDTPLKEVAALLDDSDAGLRMGEAGRGVIRARQGATRMNVEILHGLVFGSDGSAESGFGISRWGVIRRYLTVAMIIYMVTGYLTTAFATAPVQDGSSPTTPLPTLDGELASGVFSVHTDRSHDARGTREDVARAAVSAGLDFVVIGDHPPDDRKPGWEFWEPIVLDGVLIEGGQELRSPGAGKILAVGVDTTYKQWDGDYDSFSGMLAREEATAFVVHGRGLRGSERWVNPDTRGVQGWEVLDISEFSRHRLGGPWSLYHLVTLLIGTPIGFGDEALVHLMREGFDTPTVAAYDSLRARAPLTATAGVNIHPKLRIGPFLLPSYRPFFRSIVNHVALPGNLPGDPGQGRRSLMEAVRTGNLFVAVGGDVAARDFRMGVVGLDQIVIPMGGEVEFAPGAKLRAGFATDPGRKVVFRVLRNGDELAWFMGPELEWEASEPGIYRVEAYSYTARVGETFFRLRPWIFGNPVRLLDNGSLDGPGAEEVR